LLTNNSLVNLGELLEEAEEDSLVWVEFPDLSELFCDSEENLVVFFLDKS